MEKLQTTLASTALRVFWMVFGAAVLACLEQVFARPAAVMVLPAILIEASQPPRAAASRLEPVRFDRAR